MALLNLDKVDKINETKLLNIKKKKFRKILTKPKKKTPEHEITVKNWYHNTSMQTEDPYSITSIQEEHT